MLSLWFFANTILAQFYGRLGGLNGLNLSMNTVVLGIAGIFLIRRSKGSTLGLIRFALILFGYFVFSIAIAILGPCQDLPLKALLTIPILLFLLVAALKVGESASTGDWLRLGRSAQWALLFAFVSFLMELLAPSLFPNRAQYRSRGELSGIFPEPSHVAVSLILCVVVLLSSPQRRWRQSGWLALAVLLVFSRSSTLIVMTVAWIIYRYVVRAKAHQAFGYIMVSVSLVGVAAAVNYDQIILPTWERISGIVSTDASTNISSLVYVQGWQDTWFNLERTHGLGLGANMMGCGVLPDVSSRLILSLHDFGELNADDGSFLFAKIVSETGVVGILLYLLIIWRWVYLERRLPRLVPEAVRAAAKVQTALIFCFIVLSFVRSTGYFDGVLLIGVAALGGASRWARSMPSQLLPELGRSEAPAHSPGNLSRGNESPDGQAASY